MSLPERKRIALDLFGRAAAAVVVLAALALGSACTVRPLYSQDPSLVGPGGSTLPSIAVVPVQTRYAQEVRNHLIFLLNRGAAEPVKPDYKVALNVTSVSESTVLIQSATEDEPTAGTVTVRATYALVDADRTRIGGGLRQFTASYDVPRQEFAALRAVRDAENRAAREVAALVRLAIAQDLSRVPAQP